MSEADWKRLRTLKPVALDRLCERILKEVVECATTPGKTAHERYLDVFGRLRERDKDVAWAFDGLRRSTMLASLSAMHELGLLTDDEISSFSETTKAFLATRA